MENAVYIDDNDNTQNQVISYRRSGLLWSGARLLLKKFIAGILYILLSPSWKRQRFASSNCFRKLTSEKKIEYIISNNFNWKIFLSKNYFQYIFKLFLYCLYSYIVLFLYCLILSYSYIVFMYFRETEITWYKILSLA